MAVEKTAVPMREQPAAQRRSNFDEVPYGYNEAEALREASRCLQCKKKPCVEGCPVRIDIPAFIRAIRDREYDRALRIIKEADALPCVTGRVCPQEDQCQKVCVVGKMGEPVSIGRLERFVADRELAERRTVGMKVPEKAPPTGKRVAVVGSGPAGLTCAADLVRLGHVVTVFEGYHAFGGVLLYGIPEFRLPKAIVQAEIDYLHALGVEFSANVLVGRAITVGELLSVEGYHAVFLGTGAGLPNFMGIPGENLNGVYSANEYLTRVNLMKAYRFPEYDTPVKRGRNVAVIGGGNVAMDAARTAVRLGAQNVYLIYRRSEAEMPARIEEVHHAREEGVIFKTLTNPIRYLGDERGFVQKAECLRMQLGEPDASGRRAPVPVPGSEFTLDVDQVIVAVGTTPNPIIARTTPGLATKRKGEVVADDSGRTSIPGVFAGGDIVTGSATVVTAMGMGRTAARAIHEYLTAA
jgi:glutamate synthase (NADPH/NADH) small chain